MPPPTSGALRSPMPSWTTWTPPSSGQPWKARGEQSGRNPTCRYLRLIDEACSELWVQVFRKRQESPAFVGLRNQRLCSDHLHAEKKQKKQMEDMPSSCVTLGKPTTVSVPNSSCVKGAYIASGPGLSHLRALSQLLLVLKNSYYITDHPRT